MRANFKKGAGMAIGICVGAGIGVAMKQLAAGIAVGVAIGAGLETMRAKLSKDQKE